MIHSTRLGRGKPLLLVHGLGGNTRSWDSIAEPLARDRELILIDLPGHGASPAFTTSGTFTGLADSLANWLEESDLLGVDMAGSSMGARLVLEMARRGLAGNVVALDPGGFWRGWERRFFATTIAASVRLLRALRPALPALSRNPVSRSALLAQFSARPWKLDGDRVAEELCSYVATPTFDALVRDLARGPEQKGPAAAATGRIAIGWGRKDRLCLPRQAKRAKAAFPTATLHWFERSGHFPAWDQPDETVRMILESTSN